MDSTGCAHARCLTPRGLLSLLFHAISWRQHKLSMHLFDQQAQVVHVDSDGTAGCHV